MRHALLILSNLQPSLVNVQNLLDDFIDFKDVLKGSTFLHDTGYLSKELLCIGYIEYLRKELKYWCVEDLFTICAVTSLKKVYSIYLLYASAVKEASNTSCID